MILALLLILVPTTTVASTQLLPASRPVPMATADPGEVRLMLASSGSGLHSIVGNWVSLLSVEDVFLGIEGRGFFTLRQEGSRFPLETVDGLFGLYLEGRVGPAFWQLRYTHVSAHLADGLIMLFASAYSRETATLKLGLGKRDAFLFAAARYLTHSDPQLAPWGAQLGGSWVVIPQPVSPFFSVDLQWREEWTQQFAVSLQGGLAIRGEKNQSGFRVFYQFYSGMDPRGQFHTESTVLHLIGCEGTF